MIMLRTFAERIGFYKPKANEELGVSEDSVFRKWNLFPYSPDKLIQRKKFDIFEEMAKDDQIAQCLAARKILLLAPGWEIKPADDTPEAQKQADFIEWNLSKKIEGTFHDDLWEIAGALEIGWSLSEKVYDIVKEEGSDWNGMWYLKALKSKNFRDYNLVRDDYDNLVPDGISRITHPQLGQRFPISKFVVYSYRKRFEDTFGTSILRSLYDLWWLKHVLKRALGVHFERAGIPVATAKYPKGMSEVEQDKLFQLVKSIRFESAAVMPKEVELAFTEAKSKAGEAFIEAIKHIDDQIVKTILGQTLTQSQGDRGSQALGNIHKDILVLYVEELARDISIKAVNTQIIKDLIDFNFPKPLYPTFVFKPISPEDESGRVNSFLQAVEKGVVLPTEADETEIRKMLGFDEREADDVLVQKPTPPGLAGTPFDPNPETNPGMNPDAPKIGKDGKPLKSAPASAPQANKPKRGPVPPLKNGKADGTPAEEENDAEELQERIFTGVRRRSFTGPEKRVDFAEALETIEVDGVEDMLVALSPILQETQDDLLAQVQRFKIMENQDSKAIEQLAVRNLGDIRAELKDGLTRIARRGRKSALDEIRAAKKEANLAEPFNISKFLPEEVEKLFADRAFSMAGVIRDDILKMTKQSLFSSVKNGLDYRAAASGIKSALAPYVAEGIVDVADASGPKLETIVRTNVVDAYNMARREEYKRDIKFVPGLQYSAILDDRVRDNHAAMDGKEYKTDDPIWDHWTPPNGYNCRCVLVPVTLADGNFEPDAQPPKSVQPDPGFKANGQ